MSSFPQRVDPIPYIKPVDLGGMGASAALVTTLNSALHSIEAHVGFSLVSGGDIRVDGTAVNPSPGRRVLTMSGTWHVTPNQEGLYGFLTPLSNILDSVHLNQARVSGITNVQITDLLASITDPLFIRVRRRKTGLTLTSAIVVNQAGKAMLAVSLPYGIKDTTKDFGGSFLTGEILDVFSILWGGT